MNYINKLICIVTCFLPYIPYNCNAMHYQQPDDHMSACEQGKRSCKSDDVKPMIFTDLPDHVLRPIAAYLSENDIIQLSRTCTYLHTMVTGSQPHFLVPYIAHSLARKVDNPMQLIRDRRLQAIRDEKNKADAPRIVVHGCTVPASELEAAVADELQESIIDLLTSRELDPIEYVCSESQGASTVFLYGKEFDTIALLNKLRSLGFCPMRVSMRVREGNGRLTLESFFNNSDRGGYQGIHPRKQR